ncbi:hypothetical protein M5K25_015377 [Dendrobium thyrsiflorum]|uniref:NAD-dependent epimerase/dehydratase domain-containing protein n=1 Tax=Dendrobium thyrsiflorum TaxID=117978 RepID=A0ABD0UX17_DENTH
MSAINETVCVTGGSGFIGSWLVRLLLDRGYTVHATVQNLQDDAETKHLEALEGAPARLRLFQLNLLDPASIVAALRGATGVFHLASPCIVDRVHDPEAQLLEPAVKGTLNVLRAAHDGGVRRVVVTSSTSAIMPSPGWPTDVIWYPVSKTMAEKQAWDFAKENGLDLVVVNPGAVMGPIIPPSINASMLILLRLLQGCTEHYEDIYMGSVHVKDVALAHILLYENPSASGRHLCVESIIHFSDFASKVAELYPDYNVSKFPKDTQPGLLRAQYPSKKLINLGMQFVPIEQIIKDSVESLKSKEAKISVTAAIHSLLLLASFSAGHNMSAINETVCVTGGSGFIGSWLVRLLLDRGYTVHATVQNLQDDAETKHLEALEGAPARLRLFQLNLLDPASIVAVLRGATGVFHLASPCIVDRVHDPEAQLLEPAVKGTLNVLRAAHDGGVRRVVVTSSISAIMPSPGWPTDVVKDENCWTDLEYCRENGIWYPASKTMAEKQAWDFAKENGLDLVVVNPGTVMGPIIPPSINASMLMLLRLLQGCTEHYEDFYMGSVHVKDVALAHILLYENPSASGRHLCVESIIHFSDFASKVAELYPEYNVPKFPKDTQPGLLRAQYPSKKLINLGMQFVPIEQIIKDSVESLKSKGHIS